MHLAIHLQSKPSVRNEFKFEDSNLFGQGYNFIAISRIWRA